MKIAVVGLGLIGTSFLKSLQGKGHDLIGVSRNPETVKKALAQNLVKESSTDFEVLHGADVIFVATPIDVVCETIYKASKVAPNATIADLASVKEFVLDYVHNMDTKIDFVGLHPMAGTENKGFDSAEEGLFEGSKWAVVPSNFAKQESVDTLVKIIESIGANIIITDAKTHDKAVAMISHAPMILAQALFVSAKDNTSKALAASGFRDMTRLAMSNPDMARDMVKYNGQNIKECLEEIEQSLKKLLENYPNSDLETIIAQRKDMYTEDGKNKF